MTATELVFLSEMQRFTLEARVISIQQVEERTAMILDSTLFYPQGGGQPADRGEIRGSTGTFLVSDVRTVDERVFHYGTLDGVIAAGDEVILHVDEARRTLNTRVHSAGHVVDMAVQALGLDWAPGKAYHFPDGPYVEYLGTLDGDKDVMQKNLEREINVFTRGDIPTSMKFFPHSELASILKVVPAWAPVDKPCRVVFYGDFGVPCGGTHVANLRDIGAVTVRKLKPGAGTVRVAYGVT